MARIDHRFVFSAHDRTTGKKHTIHLCEQRVKGRFWIKRDGRNSRKMPEATGSEIMREFGRWLSDQQKLIPPYTHLKINRR